MAEATSVPRAGERLHRVLARAGVSSRRGAEELIARGRVAVNGQRVTRPGVLVDPHADRVEVDGRAITTRPDAPFRYWLLHKPEGVVSTVRDTHGRRTVLDLVPEVDARVYPVGRLDADSEGLLLLTDDGDLTYRLTQAHYEVEKEYHAQVRGSPRPEVLAALVSPGVRLEDGLARAVRAALLHQEREASWVRVVLHEGRKREVRRMLAAIGHPVLGLRRVRIGPLRLGSLAPGESRRLSQAEVAALRGAVGLPDAAQGEAGGRG